MTEVQKSRLKLLKMLVEMCEVRKSKINQTIEEYQAEIKILEEQLSGENSKEVYK